MINAVADLPPIDAQTTSTEVLGRARRAHWAARSERGVEVLRFKAGLKALEHSKMEKGASFRRRLDDLGIVDGDIRDKWNRMLVTNEDEYRRRMRIPLSALMRPGQIGRLRPVVQQIVGSALDEIEDKGDVDFMQAFAWKLPPRVYCHLVSAPLELAPTVARLSDSVLAPILTVDKTRKQESIDAFFESFEFVTAHVKARRDNLGDDFTSLMIRQQLEGLLTEEELIYEAVSILQASIDNTVHQIGLLFGTLLEAPERWRQLVEKPELINAAVEECIRLRPRFGTIFRYAREATSLEELEIPADTWVFVSVRSAQRDEEIFEDAESFRLDRSSTRALMFGAGPYNCLGQTLARLEAQEAVRAVVQRYPNARLIDTWRRRDTNAVTETASLKLALE